MNSQHETCVPKANYYLRVCNVHLKIDLSTE